MLPGLEHHPHARAVLQPALLPGTASHAYLFQGPAGSGKRAVARALAGAWLAQGAEDPQLVRERVERDAHPDLAWVVPSGAAEILVSDIDEPVIAAATRTPFESSKRVFVIESAHTMNVATANRLLKTLEEPPSFVHLILLTDRPSEILPTIASRCQIVRFDPLPTQVLADQIAAATGVGAPTAQAAARLALGDGERALELAGDAGAALRAGAQALAREGDWEQMHAIARAAGARVEDTLRAQHESELEFTARGDRKRVEREQGERSKRLVRRAFITTLDFGLSLCGLWFRDVLAVAIGESELVHASDCLQTLGEDAQLWEAPALLEALACIDDTRARLVLNVNEELALQALAYRLAAIAPSSTSSP